jgi:hypothetical protein
MKRFYFILILILAISATSFPQSGKARADEKTERELIELEREIGQANIRRDKAFFERIEAEEFLFTDSGGGVTTKQEDIASVDKPVGSSKLVAYDVDDTQVRQYGKTAVVTGRVTSTYRNKDKDISVRTRFTDVFVRRNGRWQIVAGHSSRIREPQK